MWRTVPSGSSGTAPRRADGSGGRVLTLRQPYRLRRVDVAQQIRVVEELLHDKIAAVQGMLRPAEQILHERVEILPIGHCFCLGIAVVRAYERIAEVACMLLKRLVFCVEPQVANVEHRKHGCRACVSLVERVHLPDARDEARKVIDLLGIEEGIVGIRFFVAECEGE